ncbi:hypothetical protein AL755_10680 [Arthrobacter sp. ERGS1:01]|nr:hypothetical protein AL755_10680 [Arthrobacter sp. ERGS1:01]
MVGMKWRRRGHELAGWEHPFIVPEQQFDHRIQCALGRARTMRNHHCDRSLTTWGTQKYCIPNFEVNPMWDRALETLRGWLRPSQFQTQPTQYDLPPLRQTLVFFLPAGDVAPALEDSQCFGPDVRAQTASLMLGSRQRKPKHHTVIRALHQRSI